MIFEYGAYIASFDSDDDDDGNGTPDLRAVPEWVAYEIKRFGPETTGQYPAPNPSVRRPSKWYDHPDLDFLTANLPGNPGWMIRIEV